MRQHIRGVSVNASIVLTDAGRILPANVKTNLERLVMAARRMNDLTDAILAYSRLVQQKTTLGTVDLSSIAASLAAEIKARANYNAATVISIQQGMTCWGDAAMMKTVLANLLDNACKFSTERPEPRVEVGHNGSSFFVKDNGVGFDEQYAEQIFKPFERLEPSLEGAGIGLASVKRIVQRHGGRVWAESACGEGTTIWYSLPNDSVHAGSTS